VKIRKLQAGNRRWIDLGHCPFRVDNGRVAATPQGGLGMAAHLRVYPSTEDLFSPEFPEPSVRVRLGDLLPLVTMAKQHNYQWLRDFMDDEVCITEDLYEVLQAFREYRPSA